MRHLLQDQGVWPECGNNPHYSRINTTDPFPDACFWSSSQYKCEHQCCSPVWTEQPKGASVKYAWEPPTPDFFPAPGAATDQFATLQSDGTLYFPPTFDKTKYPYEVFTAPLVLFGDGSVNPLTGAAGSAAAHEAAKDCPNGVNHATGCAPRRPLRPCYGGSAIGLAESGGGPSTGTATSTRT